MIEDVKKEASARMTKCVDALHNAFVRVRTGRANVSLLEHVKVDYYGSSVPLTQVASVVIEDVRTITISPWEKQMVTAIEKAIMGSDLGLTPSTAGTVIRIVMPPLTEERRRELTKVVRQEAEQARVAVRNIRRDANQEIKELTKEKMISDDEEKRGETEIQKLTDQFVAKIDQATSEKEQEVLAV